MQDLTPVGLSKDGKRLLLVSASGEEFAVPVGPRLRAALRGENARLGQLEMKMESALRPRDIQARIRAGESPADVAAAAQTTVEAIMGFATPVLAERAHVARNAQRASVRRRTNEAAASARTLGEAAEAYFATQSLHDEDVAWDSWRRSDGRWVLVAEYAVGGRPRKAEFTHDVAGRYVVADNDEARLLTGEMRPPESRAPQGTGSVRRLAPVPSQDQLPLGDDALEMVRDRDAEPESTGSPETGPDPTADTADADWMAPADGAAPVERPAGSPEEQADEAAGRPEHEPAPEAAPEPGPVPEPQPAAMEENTERQPAKKKGRSSVPSWDEIMFGGGKGD